MKTKQNKLKLQIFEGIRFRLSSRCKVTTGSKLELVPCLEEDRIDRKCLGREIDNERVEMPLECRSLADLCTRNRRRGGGGRGSGGEGKERAVTMRVAFLAWPSHLHLVSHLLFDRTAQLPDFHIVCKFTGLSTTRRPFC